MNNKTITLFAALLFVAALFLVPPAPSFAQGGGFTGGARPGGGFTGPGQGEVTVRQALQMRDNAYVTLTGNIVQHIGGEKYLFRDATGAIAVEIDDDEWGGQAVGPEDTVQLHGKIDKDWNSVEVEVKRLTKK